MGDRSPTWKCRAANSPADRNEIVHANALHDEELAWAIALPVHVMRRLRRYSAPLARHKPSQKYLKFSDQPIWLSLSVG